MRMPVGRSFTILDAMVLVGATALGFACLHEVNPLEAYGGEKFWTYAPELLPPFLTYWAIALLVLRFRQPRPRRNRLAIEPGASACLAVTVVTALAAVSLGCSTIHQPFTYSPTSFLWTVTYLAKTHAPDAVAAVWIFQIMGRRWRPEPVWIDRMGRSIGFLWLAYELSIWWRTGSGAFQ